MESSAQPELATLALQVQAEELTKQNQEIRQRLQQEENRPPRRVENNKNEDEVQGPKGSQRRNGSRRTEWSDKASNNLLRSMRKEMDKLKNAIKGKTAKNLDGKVRRIDYLFTQRVLNHSLLPKFQLL